MLSKIAGIGVSAAFALFMLPQLVVAEESKDATAVFAASQRDGSHDFDFLIGNWKAHVRRLPDRLNGSTHWDEYDGISNHKKLLDTNANFEEFEVNSPDQKL